jgi:hypothetical protein
MDELIEADEVNLLNNIDADVKEDSFIKFLLFIGLNWWMKIVI